jgi:hypothetical protein
MWKKVGGETYGERWRPHRRWGLLEVVPPPKKKRLFYDPPIPPSSCLSSIRRHHILPPNRQLLLGTMALEERDLVRFKRKLWTLGVGERAGVLSMAQ